MPTSLMSSLSSKINPSYRAKSCHFTPGAFALIFLLGDAWGPHRADPCRLSEKHLQSVNIVERWEMNTEMKIQNAEKEKKKIT